LTSGYAETSAAARRLGRQTPGCRDRHQGHVLRVDHLLTTLAVEAAITTST
jgi:hypothetical protein